MRERAIAWTLFPETTLGRAVERLGFVQADPIKSPAPAQDLILRQRVKNYRVGDLEKRYRALGLEEDFLYAYGFMTGETRRLLHPRMEIQLSPEQQRVLEFVTNRRRAHPGDLEKEFGRALETNAWGGQSKATTQALHILHHRGLLRVAGRRKGIRMYEAARNDQEPLDREERMRRVVLLMASILGPQGEANLRSSLRYVAVRTPALKGVAARVTEMIRSGELAAEVVGDIRYVWPAEARLRVRREEMVRFLAPFDPLVWDRQRFEQFWGWAYRFEAYVPAAKRQMGYYTLPMLWRDDVIGWVNAAQREGVLNVEAGYVRDRPKDAAFRRAYEAEVERLRLFLTPH